MENLFILQNSNSSSPFDTWAVELCPNINVFTFTGKESNRNNCETEKSRFFYVDNYESPELFEKVIEVAKEHPPTRIFSNSEVDVYRAATLRELFNIPGMKTNEAICFRDKVLMKNLFEKASLKAARYNEVWCISDVTNSILEFGKCVLKPRQGQGSVGVLVLTSCNQFLEYCKNNSDFIDEINNGVYFVEEFAEGKVYHIDALLKKRQVLLLSMSEYLNPPHKFSTYNLGSCMLDDTHVHYSLLKSLTQKLIDECSEFENVNIMHLEIYVDDFGNPIVGEVASRTGGALIKQGIQHTYGVDVGKLSLELELETFPQSMKIKKIREYTAFCLQTSPKSIIRHELKTKLPKWVNFYEERGREQEAKNSVDASAKVLIHGESYSKLSERLKWLSGS